MCIYIHMFPSSVCWKGQEAKTSLLAISTAFPNQDNKDWFWQTSSVDTILVSDYCYSKLPHVLQDVSLTFYQEIIFFYLPNNNTTLEYFHLEYFNSLHFSLFSWTFYIYLKPTTFLGLLEMCYSSTILLIDIYPHIYPSWCSSFSPAYLCCHVDPFYFSGKDYHQCWQLLLCFFYLKEVSKLLYCTFINKKFYHGQIQAFTK